jgi:hypothetical protein
MTPDVGINFAPRLGISNHYNGGHFHLFLPPRMPFLRSGTKAAETSRRQSAYSPGGWWVRIAASDC